MWQYSESQVSMVFVDGLVLVWHQDICNYCVQNVIRIDNLKAWISRFKFLKDVMIRYPNFGLVHDYHIHWQSSSKYVINKMTRIISALVPSIGQILAHHNITVMIIKDL